MITLAAVFVLGGGIGFGIGRIKNASKIAAITAEVKAVEGKVTADFAAVVAKIKSLL